MRFSQTVVKQRVFILIIALALLIPLFFKEIGLDPAVASGPLITTINDLIAVVAYYGLSWLILFHVMRLI